MRLNLIKLTSAGEAFSYNWTPECFVLAFILSPDHNFCLKSEIFELELDLN